MRLIAVRIPSKILCILENIKMVRETPKLKEYMKTRYVPISTIGIYLLLFIQYLKRSTLLANKPFYQVALYNIVKQLTYHTIIYKFTYVNKWNTHDGVKS